MIIWQEANKRTKLFIHETGDKDPPKFTYLSNWNLKEAGVNDLLDYPPASANQITKIGLDPIIFMIISITWKGKVNVEIVKKCQK